MTGQGILGRCGYARVSTTRQPTDNQVTDLTREKVPEGVVVTETIPGETAWKSRPELWKLVRRLQAGDSLTVVKLNRLRRNALDVLTFIDLLKKRGISVRMVNLGIDTSGIGGRLFLPAGCAEFERNIIRDARAVVAGNRQGQRHLSRPGAGPPRRRHRSAASTQGAVSARGGQALARLEDNRLAGDERLIYDA